MEKKESNMRLFYDEIVHSLVTYKKLSYDEARDLLEKSHLYDPEKDNDFTEIEDILDHEIPYFWAMVIFYRYTNPYWDDDPELWPPPKEAVRRWCGDDFFG